MTIHSCRSVGYERQRRRCLASRAVVVAVVGWLVMTLIVVDALATAPSSANIFVHPILSPSSDDDDDVTALGNLRFDEWIAEQYPDTSRAAFLSATADIHRERTTDGAVAFLARSSDGLVMGGGELSPMELQGALRTPSTTDPDHITATSLALYVTDLVTAKAHRRKGVALAIMQAMEAYARTTVGASYLLLHVKPSNTAALAFYTRHADMGYTETLPSTLAACLDTALLEENAGTAGQVLLCKTLSPQTFVASKRSVKSKNGKPGRSAGRGFG